MDYHVRRMSYSPQGYAELAACFIVTICTAVVLPENENDRFSMVVGVALFSLSKAHQMRPGSPLKSTPITPPSPPNSALQVVLHLFVEIFQFFILVFVRA